MFRPTGSVLPEQYNNVDVVDFNKIMNLSLDFVSNDPTANRTKFINILRNLFNILTEIKNTFLSNENNSDSLIIFVYYGNDLRGTNIEKGMMFDNNEDRFNKNLTRLEQFINGLSINDDNITKIEIYTSSTSGSNDNTTYNIDNITTDTQFIKNFFYQIDDRWRISNPHHVAPISHRVAPISHRGAQNSQDSLVYRNLPSLSSLSSFSLNHPLFSRKGKGKVKVTPIGSTGGRKTNKKYKHKYPSKRKSSKFRKIK